METCRERAFWVEGTLMQRPWDESMPGRFKLLPGAWVLTCWVGSKPSGAEKENVKGTR